MQQSEGECNTKVEQNLILWHLAQICFSVPGTKKKIITWKLTFLAYYVFTIADVDNTPKGHKLVLKVSSLIIYRKILKLYKKVCSHQFFSHKSREGNLVAFSSSNKHRYFLLLGTVKLYYIKIKMLSIFYIKQTHSQAKCLEVSFWKQWPEMYDCFFQTLLFFLLKIHLWNSIKFLRPSGNTNCSSHNSSVIREIQKYLHQ